MRQQNRTELTYHYERWRAVSSGVLETAAGTFLLLIAVRHFRAGPSAKALIAAGGSLGLLLSPLVVSVVEFRRWRTAKAASRLAAVGGAGFLLAALFPFLPVFIIGCIIGTAS